MSQQMSEDTHRTEVGRKSKRLDRRLLIGTLSAVALGLIVALVVFQSRNEDATAEEVATSFIEAYGAFNAEQAITHLADDADISGMIGSVGAPGVEGTHEELRLLISLLEAQGYKQTLSSCEELFSSAAGTRLQCTFDYHNFRSDEIGRGPFSGSSFALKVRDGEIVHASKSFGIEEFSPQMWEPFARWVSTTHPEDAAVMYGDETHTGVRLTEKSIGLWKRHTRGYVEEVAAPARPARAKLVVTEAGVRFSFRVPRAAWGSFESIPTKKSAGGPISLNRSTVGSQGAEAILYWTSFPDGDYADPCTRLLSRPVGRSAADLAAAVSTAPGTKLVKGPSDVTLGGHPAKHVVLTVRKSVGCDPGFFYKWEDVLGGALWTTTSAGDTVRVWVVPVGGTRLFIAAATNEDASARLKREVKQIVESIRFCCA